jgi:3-oxoacyl-[acyl-carrier protein] reductase
MFDLTGKTALVTGASGGLGQVIARTLYQQGATVALSGTHKDRLDAIASEFAAGKAHVLPCNLMEKTQVDALVPAAEAAMGTIDILVNNAGMTRDNLFLRMKDEEWDNVLAVNLSAVFRLSRAAVKGMLKRRYGRIIGISSVVGTTGNPGQANYAASKAGMVAMSKCLASEVATRNVTVNCVAPGFIESPMTEVLNERQRSGILQAVPMGRLGNGEDIAAAVLYLASMEAGYVTGQTLHVNGGMVMI